jgi:hypothetical protein
MKKIPNYNTFADLCDRLAVTVHKLAYYENEKRKESLKKKPNKNLIVKWDRQSRNECEFRNMLKCEINRALTEIVSELSYETLPDNRTFIAPTQSVEDLLDEMYWRRANKSLRKSFAEAMRRELLHGRKVGSKVSRTL